MNDLYRPRLLPDLLIAALDRSGERPCLYIDGDVLTAAQLRDEISRYVQAFRALGIACGEGVATLSKNRPEVLCSMGAVMVAGCRNTPLHPLGVLRRPRLRARGRGHRHSDLRSRLRRAGRPAA